MARCGARGYGDGLFFVHIRQCKVAFLTCSLSSGLLGGKVIGLPPVLNFASDNLKAKVVPDVLAGKKFICLAISEAHAGSDVLGLQTTAVKTKDGKEWIVNGTKKWITNGTSVPILFFGEYFAVL